MHSYLLSGTRLGPLIKMLREEGFTPSPGNLGRLLFLLQNGVWTSIHHWREKIKYGRLLADYPAPQDPVIIIGHWRTGSTFLHQLLALDEQFVTPSLFQATFPDGLMVSEKYYRPLLNLLVKNRPMDNVRLGFNDPQEDEFAILRLGIDSPLRKIIFPVSDEYFMNLFEDFVPPQDHREEWKSKFVLFCKKVQFKSGKRLLLKNPAHSLRIPFLREIFPNARFIHIHRHPYKVVASSLHLWKVVNKDNQLKKMHVKITAEDVADGLNKFYSAIREQFQLLPEEQHCEISYEALEQDPVGELKKLYTLLGLDFTQGFKGKFVEFLHEVKEFRKNVYSSNDQDHDLIYQRLKRQFDHYNYKR